MAHKLSRKELVAVAEILMAEDNLRNSEIRHLIDDFETTVRRPEAADLIRRNKQEFKDAVECVQFLLGEEKYQKLSRAELVEVTRKLMNADTRNEVDTARMLSVFEANVPHPDGTDLIFWPKIEFDTPEALVDYALSYKAPKTKN
jgi:hypothetical protein